MGFWDGVHRPEGIWLIRLAASSKLSPFCRPFPLDYLIPFQSTGHFYRYQGSLTSPPCTENVAWTVFGAVGKITLKHLAVFEALKRHNVSGALLGNNFRKFQKRNNRKVLLNT